jgi:S-sulfo-L-cysteine synthase (O-acetyl-L-serine-dependent)
MNHATRVYNSVLEMLPSVENPSPMVLVRRLVPPASVIYAKLEWANPFGSVKDRAASFMVQELESRGRVGWHRTPDGREHLRGIVEPTSGNTGLSLAGICAVLGYPIRTVVPEKVPQSKRDLLAIAGAEVDVVPDSLCPLPGQDEGTIALAKTHARASSHRYTMPNQYENAANVRAHARTTGPEIWRQTEGLVSHVFVSLGTCGTAVGLATFLRARSERVKVIAVQPSRGHRVPGIRNTSELEACRLYDASLIDEVIEVEHELAYSTALDLCRREGLFAGPSSGLIFEGARRVARREVVSCGVAIFCDSAFKYADLLARYARERGPETDVRASNAGPDSGATREQGDESSSDAQDAEAPRETLEAWR